MDRLPPAADLATAIPLRVSEPDEVAVQLAESMRLRWQVGERPLAEEFLSQHPELWTRPDEALEMVYEEFTLRRKFGLDSSPELFYTRFPQWREAIRLLLECHELFEGLTPPAFPEVGEPLGDFELLAQLGEGGKGRVFLATQTSLGGRPVVLKLTPDDGREHLSLARLQHTHIVPLHATSADPERRLRILVMPYFGGATLQQILQLLAGKPIDQLTGNDILAALDAAPIPLPAPTAGREPARLLLAKLSYVKAVCYLGACLADALHYAHERGLLHLDVKPSNVLISADGDPMLLDFHLAHEPLPVGAAPVEEFGGTPAYMAPELCAGLESLRQGNPLSRPIDARADVFGLGALMYELLGGTLPHVPGKSPPLAKVNQLVGRGLSDLIERCLAPQVQERPGTAELAEDLRREVNDQPLLSVPNRSWTERWKKWRQRHPSGLRSWLLLVATLLTTLAGGLAIWLYIDHHIDEGHLALREGRTRAEARQYEEAIAVFQRGLEHLNRVPFHLEVQDQLRADLHRAEQARLRGELHRLAEQLRGLHGSELSQMARAALEERCREFWARCEALAAGLGEASTDLLDVALLWADVQPRTPEGARKALGVLDEAESLLGPSPVLTVERQWYQTGSLQLPTAVVEQARTAWEHHALGRALLRAGRFDLAEHHLERAIALRLEGRWSHFLLGLCTYRREHYDEAVTAFTYCLGAAPDDPVCWYNRGLAYQAMKDYARALADYDRVVNLAPAFAPARQNRGLLHYHEKRYAEARADFEHALALGAPPAAVNFNLALVAIARKDNTGARSYLERALKQDMNHAEARKLLEQLAEQP